LACCRRIGGDQSAGTPDTLQERFGQKRSHLPPKADLPRLAAQTSGAYCDIISAQHPQDREYRAPAVCL
jgi:hypothetical protein